MLALGGAMVAFPEGAFKVVVLIIGAGLIAMGVKNLFYYFTMAMHMVGGKLSLYKGIILVDFGILTCSLSDVPQIYVVLYLAVLHAFSGLVEILRALEAKRYGGRSWRMKLGHGIVNVAICLICIVKFKQPDISVIIYGLGLAYSGLVTVVSSFKKTTLVYIQ